MPQESIKTKAGQLEELKRELAALKVSISVVGEHSEHSRELIDRRTATLEKIRRLEDEIQEREV
jgi:antitoxin component HigA of HigAB toxin-antitoxin module